MGIRFRAPLLLALLSRGAQAADHVTARDGDIVLEDSSGRATALTQTGRDSDPWLGRDGRTVLFLRHTANDLFRNSVYEIDLRTRKERLLYAGPARYQGRESPYFGRPELDDSRGTLFLISKEYATEGA